MKVILAADAITPQLTGIGQYALALAKGLSEHKDIEERYLYSSGMFIKDYNFLLKHNPKQVFKNTGGLRYFIRSIYHKVSPKILSIWLKFLSADLYHGPSFVLHDIDLPTIATIHDLSFIHYPAFHTKDRVRYWKEQLLKTIEKASHLITDTEFVRSELIEMFDVSPEKITAIPLGVRQDFKPRQEIETKETLLKYNLSYGNYLLSVATIEPRKNLANVLKAFCQLPKTVQEKYPLVLAGSKGWLSDDLHKETKRLENEGLLKYLGYVPEKDLKHLYSSARGFVYVSFYEGFGLPVIEAMASGTLVLTSNSPSLKEVAGDSAILANPFEIESIKEGLIKLLEIDDESRQKKIQDGISYVSNFTWDKCVEKTVVVYKQVVKLK